MYRIDLCRSLAGMGGSCVKGLQFDPPRVEWVSTDIRSRVHLRVSHRPEEKKGSESRPGSTARAGEKPRAGGRREEANFFGGKPWSGRSEDIGICDDGCFFVSVGSRRGESEVGRARIVFVFTWVSCDGFVCVCVYDCKAHHRSQLRQLPRSDEMGSVQMA